MDSAVRRCSWKFCHIRLTRDLVIKVHPGFFNYTEENRALLVAAKIITHLISYLINSVSIKLRDKKPFEALGYLYEIEYLEGQLIIWVAQTKIC